MSAMQELEAEGFTIPEWVKVLLTNSFYAWADEHQHDVVVKKKILFLTVTITVKDCEWLVKALIGPRL